MTGFVGSRAKKRQRNIFFTLTLLAFISVIILFFPTLENSNIEIIPNDNIIPDPLKDLSSLTSSIEELELSLFQKEQKINFRDGQIKNLQSELKKNQFNYDLIVLDLNNIKNDLGNKDLISSNKLQLLQQKFTKLNIQNDKNILIIKNLNQKIDNSNNDTLLTKKEVEKIISNNIKLTKDAKVSFAKNMKLDNIINNLNNNIKKLNHEINQQLKQIKKLKDRSLHGG